jgi:hypothetical protein
LRTKCGSEFTEQRERQIIADIMIVKVIVPALLDPIEYNTVVDCVVPDSYHRVANKVGHILKAVMLGTPLGNQDHIGKQDHIGMYANQFIEASK